MLSVRIDGPVPGLTADGAKASGWKWNLAEEVTRSWRGSFIRQPVACALEFAISTDRFDEIALPNLLKHPIDALAHVVFDEEVGSKRGPWDREDWWVFELTASKYRATESGLAIELTQLSSVAHHVNEPGPRVDVRGRPRPWVTNGEAAWKREIGQAVHQLSRIPRNGYLGMSFEFSIDPVEMFRTDIDNLVVPAAMATAAALVDGVRHPATRISLIRATKSPAAVNKPQGVAVRSWPSSP